MGSLPRTIHMRYGRLIRPLISQPADWKRISSAASASNMENGTVEHARASNMEEDKATSPNKGKFNDVGNASDIEMATNFLHKLDNEVRSMPFQLNVSECRRSDECCIYRVPKPLRHVYREAYAPLLISIGPLHRENTRLEAMEKEKLKYFKKLTERDGMDEKKLRDIVISIKNQEERLRHCYSEKSILMESSDDFAKMILLDAVFIIQFFLESNFKPRMTFDIREDLILFENQLPLSIIKKIYDLVNPRSQDAKVNPFLDLATSHFRKYSFLQGIETNPGVEKETSPGVKRSRHFTDKLGNLMLYLKTSQGVKKETIPDVKKEPRHLTDLLRNMMLSRAIQRTYSPDLVKLKYSAIMLHKAGVRFQVTRDECLVNIKFDKGVLKIPHLKVDHNFERRVRNVMAMEECLYEHEAYICSYIKFMDHLIDTAGDVGLLVENGIILHWLGDDAAVSNMINSLCKNIGDNDTCFDDISQEINAHYENRCNHRKATLKLVYFPNIWRGTGTVAAAILLILTLIQTIRTFLLGDDAEVSKMINNLCKNIGENDTCFGEISERLNAHYDESPWNHRKATLKHVYFPNIWRGTATVAAALLLILTFIQTICSVKSVS